MWIAGWGVACMAGMACAFHGPEDLRRDLARASGVDLEREAGISLGRLSLAVARMVTDEEEVPLHGLRKIEVGVYKVSEADGQSSRGRPLMLPEPPGWEIVVRLREPGEDVFVMVERREEGVRRLLVVVVEEDEWVLVRLRGQIDGMLERAMRAAFDGADRPDLYEPAVAEYRSWRTAPRG
jgi:hypothetical protein